MGDMLNMERLNALPHPLWAAVHVNDWWPVESIDVETGLMRIDVCGLLQIEMFGGLFGLRDNDGVVYEVDDFYNEAAQPAPAPNASEE